MILPALLLQVAAAAAPLDPPVTRDRPLHDVLHYDIMVSVDDTGRHLLGQVEALVRLRSREPVVLDLDRRYRVVRSFTDGRRGPYARDEDVVAIPHEKPPGDSITVRVRWHGDAEDGLVIGTNAAGVRTVFGDNYPDRARRWLAVQDHPSDKATVTWHVEVPPGQQAIANGVLERVDTLPYGRTVWHYRQAQPIPTYTMVVGVTRFARTEVPPSACDVKCVPQAVWTYPADSAKALQGPFRRIDDIVGFLSRLIGPFPYDRLTHVESSTRYGGMENATAIFYSDRAIAAGRLGEATTAHEVAHQWFGDAVTPDEFTHVWVSEGFATYLAALWVGHAEGDSAFRATMARAAETVRRSKATERPIVDTLPSGDLVQILSSNPYQKAGWMLHSLRRLVGDTAFFGAIRRYATERQHGTARTADVQRVVEQAYGQPLEWFFRQMLAQPGYPQLDVTPTYDARRKALQLRIVQRQPEAWGTWRLPNLAVRVAGETRRVAVEGRETVVTLERVPAPPAALAIDPDGDWLLDATVAPLARR
ncbi:MAG: M1 family metallopeptidase [Gemmatimonadales bacterium]|nr:M1 family metallopeptidase [Gemmatimonadales bacterium]